MLEYFINIRYTEDSDRKRLEKKRQKQETKQSTIEREIGSV